MVEFFDREESEVHKVYRLSSGGEVHFRCQPPYGFWTVAWGRGEIPEVLSGKYVSLRTAMQAVSNYLSTRQKKKAFIAEEITPEDDAS